MPSTTLSSPKMTQSTPVQAGTVSTGPVHAGIFRHTLKRFAWIAGAYFLVLFLLLPLRAMMTLPEIKEAAFYVRTFERMYNFNSEPFQIFLIILVPFFTALLVFQHLQNATASDFHHSLPVSRNTYYGTYLTAGWTIVALPVVIIGLISLLLQQLTAMGQYLSPQEVGIWLGTTLLMNTVFYLSTVVVGMFTGVVLVQGIFTFILLFLPAGLALLVVYNLEALVWGFNATNFGMERLAQLSPLVRLVEVLYEPLTWNEVAGYGVFILLMTLAAHWLYRHRRMERNGQTIVFKGLNRLFLFGITFCTMLVGGLYAYMINSQSPWLLVVYGVFSLIGYTIARAVLTKSLRIFSWHHYRQYGLYLGLMALLMAGIHFDITGFEKRIPELDQIQGAYAGNFPHFFYYGSDQTKGLYQSPENQEQVRRIHAAILANEPRQGNRRNDYRNMTLFYHLNNGRVMARQFAVNEENYETYLTALKESEEDKRFTYPVLALSPDDLNQIMLESHELQKVAYIQDPDEMAEFLALIQQEIMEASYEELLGWPSKGDIRFHVKAADPDVIEALATQAMHPHATAEYHYGNPEVHVYRLPAFQRVETWLKEKGYYQQATVTAADIHQVAVQRVHTAEEMEPIYRSWNLNLQQSLIVEEAAAIEESLDLYSSSWMHRETFPVYMVGFYDENGRQVFMGTFDETFLPEFVRNAAL